MRRQGDERALSDAYLTAMRRLEATCHERSEDVGALRGTTNVLPRRGDEAARREFQSTRFESSGGNASSERRKDPSRFARQLGQPLGHRLGQRDGAARVEFRPRRSSASCVPLTVWRVGSSPRYRGGPIAARRAPAAARRAALEASARASSAMRPRTTGLPASGVRVAAGLAPVRGLSAPHAGRDALGWAPDAGGSANAERPPRRPLGSQGTRAHATPLGRVRGAPAEALYAVRRPCEGRPGSTRAITGKLGSAAGGRAIVPRRSASRRHFPRKGTGVPGIRGAHTRPRCSRPRPARQSRSWGGDLREVPRGAGACARRALRRRVGDEPPRGATRPKDAHTGARGAGGDARGVGARLRRGARGPERSARSFSWRTCSPRATSSARRRPWSG